jgi:hypothetical protein
LWFERWLAYPFQHVGEKLATAVAMWSLHQGTGKSLLCEVLKEVYGKWGRIIGVSDLDSSFNSWAERKQFVVVDEMPPHDSRAKADTLKKIITRTTVTINKKFEPEYELPDITNYMMTSNRPDAFFVEDRDRRFFVHQVLSKAIDPQFYRDFSAWGKGEGRGALRYYFEHFDLGDFQRHTLPPINAAKLELQEDARSELDAWVAQLRTCPDAVLRFDAKIYKHDVYTPSELRAMFERQHPGRREVVTSVGMAKALRRGGFTQPMGREVVNVDGESSRLYIIRNVEKWATVPIQKVVKHVIEGRMARSI